MRARSGTTIATQTVLDNPGAGVWRISRHPTGPWKRVGRDQGARRHTATEHDAATFAEVKHRHLRLRGPPDQVRSSGWPGDKLPGSCTCLTFLPIMRTTAAAGGHEISDPAHAGHQRPGPAGPGPVR